MKTIKQIADEIGVSKQAVHQKIKQEPLSSSLRQLTSMKGRALMIDVDGERLVKMAFALKIVKQIDDVDINETSTENVSSNSELIELLRENISVLQEQLKIKDKQIEELTATVKIQAESINHDRKNELAETIIDGNLLAAKNEKKNVFARIFRRN
ncbi:MAG: hypothetical protein FWC36_00245 [Spirochaetes bacterium]|nr:hypothetical protein [Spirochaetota bacterium]